LNPAATQGAILPPQSQSELPAGPDPAAHQPLALNAPHGPQYAHGAKALPQQGQGQDTPQLGAATSAMRSTSSLAPTPDIAPHEPQRQQQVNHIPEGNYGSSWVHKNGQVHS